MSQKYCINCKHFSPAKDDPEHQYARCSYSQSPSLVTGLPQRNNMPYCLVARMDGPNKCGVAAIYFEEASHV